MDEDDGPTDVDVILVLAGGVPTVHVRPIILVQRL